MTTGRINQVTVLHAPGQRARHEARVLWAKGPLPRPELVTDQSSRTLCCGTARHRPLERFVRQAPHPRVPSPPISHASGAFPRSSGPESTPSVKTTDERPHLHRGLPGRGGSPIGWLRTELAIGYQVHIPLHRSQQR